CQCSECQSILGAAAYFVDLMKFVDEKVTTPVFKIPKKTKDQLNLKVRRPDLWTLPLTCDNTNTLIPYLDIINQVLENYIYVATYHSAKDLIDRDPIERVVYGAVLPQGKSSFAEPFSLPLTKLDTYLQHFSVLRVDIARTLGLDNEALTKAAL